MVLIQNLQKHSRSEALVSTIVYVPLTSFWVLWPTCKIAAVHSNHAAPEPILVLNKERRQDQQA